MENEFHENHDEHDHTHIHVEDRYEDLKRKAKKFYNHRNMYLSLFSLFMILVLYRRFKDIYDHVVYQEKIEQLQLELKNGKKDVTEGSSKNVQTSAGSATKRTSGKSE
ncbi:hypothetical protein HK098_006499 [Nowakowskiella sp. JEL0407]|nr:hypothetical protein HK098_006499 [Nowakowskiella sp. JEL0407]